MFLVIGYGNELRRDDGVGPRVARTVAEWGVPGVRALAVHQLTPELADDIGRAEEVVFVDAATDRAAANISIQPVRAARSSSLANHASSPQALLALAEVLYDRRPAVWLLTVPARDLNFGEGLSSEAEKDVTQALRYVRVWIINNQEAAHP
jgi:hydrogenase maturation protease